LGERDLGVFSYLSKALPILPRRNRVGRVMEVPVAQVGDLAVRLFEPPVGFLLKVGQPVAIGPEPAVDLGSTEASAPGPRRRRDGGM
jgi:hypothetical protein